MKRRRDCRGKRMEGQPCDVMFMVVPLQNGKWNCWRPQVMKRRVGTDRGLYEINVTETVCLLKSAGKDPPFSTDPVVRDRRTSAPSPVFLFRCDLQHWGYVARNWMGWDVRVSWGYVRIHDVCVYACKSPRGRGGGKGTRAQNLGCRAPIKNIPRNHTARRKESRWLRDRTFIYIFDGSKKSRETSTERWPSNNKCKYLVQFRPRIGREELQSSRRSFCFPFAPLPRKFPHLLQSFVQIFCTFPLPDVGFLGFHQPASLIGECRVGRVIRTVDPEGGNP